MPQAVRSPHQHRRLLDCPVWRLERSVQVPCPMPRCIRDQRPGLLDNPRVPCTLEVKYASGMKVKNSEDLTARQVLQHNMQETNVDGPWWLVASCRECGMVARIVYPTDTEEKLHQDLREIATHDKCLPLYFDPQIHQPTIPAEAAEACMLAQKLDSALLTREFIAEIRWSLQHGVLHEKLQQKMGEKACSERRHAYLRVGVGLKPLGFLTAVLELWPVGHFSPRHQHGGCAGSLRVLHGVLDFKLYDNVFAKSPIRWDDGDGGLILPATPQEVLFLRPGQTTWMNRSNWFVHEVACSAEHPENQDGFALSLHVYKSCVDEFEFVGERLRHVVPSNDFFWNIDLPYDDARLFEEWPDFYFAVREGIYNRDLQRKQGRGSDAEVGSLAAAGNGATFCDTDVPFSSIFHERAKTPPRVRAAPGPGSSAESWDMDLPFDDIFDDSWQHAGGQRTPRAAGVSPVTPSSNASTEDSGEYVASASPAKRFSFTGKQPPAFARGLQETFERASGPTDSDRAHAASKPAQSLNQLTPTDTPPALHHDCAVGQPLPTRLALTPGVCRPTPPMLPLFVEALGKKLHEMRHEAEPSPKDLEELHQLFEICFPSS